MRKQVLMFLIATGASVGGIFTQPAMANCTVNVGTCDATSHCTVNVGDCSAGGACTVNLGNCTASGACTVNDNICNGGACTINLGGDCSNEDGSFICLNTTCNAGNPGDESESYTGFICIFNGGNEGSGVVFNNPTKEFGPITGGPWTVIVSDPTTNTVSDVTITCTMQSSATYGAGGVSRTSTTSGNTGVLSDTISFKRTPMTPSYLCTTVEWNSTKGHSVVIDDADNDSTNGIQCVEYTYTN